MGGLLGIALEDLDPAFLEGERGLRSLGQGLHAAEALFFHDHADFLEGIREVVEEVGLAEALLSMARHQQEDRDHWLRRLALIQREPRLRAHRARLDEDFRALLEAHFQRWGAAGHPGLRASAFEAALALGIYREAERQWVAGDGRPVLPVLVQEGLSTLWPALYQHLRRRT